jgi:hypothetical protein
LLLGLQTQTAFATVDACGYADGVADSSLPAGQNPADAVGAPDEVIVSLGQGGSITLHISGGIGIKPEYIPGDWLPDFGLAGAQSSEGHKVLISEDGVTYIEIDGGSGSPEYDIRNILHENGINTSITRVHYVMIMDDGVDLGDEDVIGSGYDLDALIVYNCEDTPPPPPTGGEGCTPGYWRNHIEDWADAGLNPGDDFDATFGIARHGTAALLSALHPAVAYPYSPAQVISTVQGGDVEDLVDANELGCAIP